MTQKNEVEEAEASLVDSIPRQHQYRTELIACSLILFTEANLSFRAIANVLRITRATEGGDSPSFHTIRLWILRFGLYQLQRERPRREDWVYVMDHSVSVDSLKCFIILAVPLSKMKADGFNVRHCDMELMDLQLMDYSNAQRVLERLTLTSARNGCPVQIVSDGGSDLKKAVALFRQAHPSTRWVYDITHRLALLVAKLFQKDPRWEELNRQINQSRSNCRLTSLSFLLPAKERSGSRWLNVVETVDWLERMLALKKRFSERDYCLGYVLPKISELKVSGRYQKRLIRRLKPLQGKAMGASRDDFAQSLRNHLGKDASARLINSLIEQSDINTLKFNKLFGWLNAYEQSIEDYAQIVKALKAVQSIIKQKGLSRETVRRCTRELAQMIDSTGLAGEFGNQLKALLEESVADYTDSEVCLGSSDVLESLFGKFKNQIKRTALGCMSASVLSVVLHTCKINAQRVLESFTSVKTDDVSKWFKQQAGESLLSLRKKAFGLRKKVRSKLSMI